jgi:hypothetical protein
MRLTTPHDPSTLAMRECQCSFCRKHGARTVTDRDGHVTFRAVSDALLRYQFSTRGADFLICRRCGVYLAALITSDGSDEQPRRSFATVNTRALVYEFTQAPSPADYDQESGAQRIARRLASWTPADLQLT